jgi:DNA-binding transcriptional MerR regulator
MKNKNDELLMATGAAKILNRSAEAVRFYERTGRLPAIRTADGTRLFRVQDVEALAILLRAKDAASDVRAV